MNSLGRNAASDILVGARAIGDAFGRSEVTIRRWARDGFLPHRRLPDGTIISSVGAIDAWIVQGMESPE